MRQKSRIPAIIKVIEDIWLQYPDMRLVQLILNSDISYYTEDNNELIKSLCTTYHLPYEYYTIWGTRGKDGSSPLVYKRISELDTDHLECILKDVEDGKLSHITSTTLDSIKSILESRKIV